MHPSPGLLPVLTALNALRSLLSVRTFGQSNALAAYAAGRK
jgi:hypothetical protein